MNDERGQQQTAKGGTYEICRVTGARQGKDRGMYPINWTLNRT